MRSGWDTTDPKWLRRQVLLQESGVTLVLKAGLDLPKNAQRLDARQRKRFWELVNAWRALEPSTTSTESARKERNDICDNKGSRPSGPHSP